MTHGDDPVDDPEDDPVDDPRRRSTKTTHEDDSTGVVVRDAQTSRTLWDP